MLLAHQLVCVMRHRNSFPQLDAGKATLFLYVSIDLEHEFMAAIVLLPLDQSLPYLWWRDFYVSPVS